MPSNLKKIIFQTAKWLIIACVGILALLFVVPMLFPEKIAKEVKSFANQNLNGELNFNKANLSFFNHFPSLTLTLSGFSLKGSPPFSKENLIASDKIEFGINLKSLLFDKEININQIYVSDANVNVLVNERGEANYNIYKGADKKESPKDSATGGASFLLNKIEILKSHVVYNDQSAKILIDADGFNYLGNGDLRQSILNLYTKAKIDKFNLTFDGAEYLKNKKIDADLITKVNTTSLSFIFEQNNLMINRLPVDFRGSFHFLKNGYDIDFNIKSTNSQLGDIFTAFPPQYVQWLSKTNIKGNTDFLMTLKGKYVVAENAKPDLRVKIDLRNGFVAYDKAPFPASNISLHFDTQLPALNADSIKVKIDSLYFNVGTDYFKGIVNVSGINKPMIEAKIQSKLDVGKLYRALGIDNGFDVKGILNSDIATKGKFDHAARLFPTMKGNLVFQKAQIKTPYYSNPINNINLVANVINTKGHYRDLQVKLSPGAFIFEGKPFSVNGNFQNLDDIAYDLKAKGELNLAKIYKVFSQKGVDVSGYIRADLTLKGKQSDATNGNYDRLHNKGTLELREVKTITEYLPKPFIIKQGLFSFNQNDMNFSDFSAIYGKSDFRMDGQMQNVINYVLSDKAVLKGAFKIKSEQMLVDEFMSASSANTKSSQTQTGVIVIPKNVDFNLIADAKKVNFQGLTLENVAGNLIINQGNLSLKDAGFKLIGTDVNMDMTYGYLSPTRASFDYSIKAKEFDIKRAYQEINMFREMATAAENAEGIVSLDYKISGKLDKKMQPIYPYIEGGGVLTVKDVKMKGFKLFSAVSKETNKEGILNPNLKEVAIKTQIKNNIMTIERFKFKVAGFRPRIEGTTSLDGKLNLKMRLGLPPLGIIGIPMSITGTQENPKIRLWGKGEALEETKEEDVEDKE